MKITPYFKGSFSFEKKSHDYSNLENVKPSKDTIIDAEYVDLTTQEKKR